MRHAFAPAVLLFAATQTLIACDQSHEQARASVPAESSLSQATSGASKALPALHVVLTWEALFSGENLARKNYQVRLDACRGAGQPTQALSAEDEAKLGTGQVEITIDARQQVARQITWTVSGDGHDMQSTCLIKLEQHEDQSEIEDPDGMYEAIDASTRVQDRQTVQANGWTLLGETEVKGQPCTRWRNDRQEVCMWSGGLQWGFSETPTDVAGCTVDSAGAYLTSIPLQGQPSQGGSGCRLQVMSFGLSKGLLPSDH